MTGAPDLALPLMHYFSEHALAIPHHDVRTSWPLKSSFQKTGKLLVAMAMCLAVGGHWFLLQAVAWTGMLITYSQETNMVQAISDTFDGEHPCSLCKNIQNGRQNEQKQDTKTELAKKDLKFVKSRASALPEPLFTVHTWPTFSQKAEPAPGEPDVPPPRVAV